MKKKLIALALAAGTALVVSAPASATIVSGIDFGNMGLTHLETMTLAQQFIDPTTTAPGTGAGQGYGFITTVNGSTSYCTAGGGCGLYYTVDFGGGTFTSASNIEFTTTTVNLYYLPTFTNLLTQDSATNLAWITGGTLYASLDGHGNLGGGLAANVVSSAQGSLSGTVLNFTGFGLLDVNLSAAGDTAFENYLNGDSEVDAIGGRADLSYTESASNSVLNSNDPGTTPLPDRNNPNALVGACYNGTAVTGDWCLQGTLNTRGTAAEIPEPGTLVLISMGLLGVGLVRRRRT